MIGPNGEKTNICLITKKEPEKLKKIVKFLLLKMTDSQNISNVICQFLARWYYYLLLKKMLEVATVAIDPNCLACLPPKMVRNQIHFEQTFDF